MGRLCYLCLVLFMLSRLFIAALWPPAGKGLTSWLLFVLFNCDFITFPCGIMGQVRYLILAFPDLCRLSYFGWIIAQLVSFFLFLFCLIGSLDIYVVTRL